MADAYDVKYTDTNTNTNANANNNSNINPNANANTNSNKHVGVNQGHTTKSKFIEHRKKQLYVHIFFCLTIIRTGLNLPTAGRTTKVHFFHINT